MLKHRIGNFVWASGSGRGKIWGSHKKLSGREGGAERRMRLLRACGLVELGQIAFCYARSLAGEQKNRISSSRRRPKQTLWERNSWEVSGEGRRINDRTKERIHKLRVRYRREKERRERHLPCLSLGFGDDK